MTLAEAVQRRGLASTALKGVAHCLPTSVHSLGQVCNDLEETAGRRMKERGRREKRRLTSSTVQLSHPTPHSVNQPLLGSNLIPDHPNAKSHLDPCSLEHGRGRQG